MVSNLSFAIKKWAAWAPGLISYGNNEVDVATIPAAVRRRCSSLSKAALAIANQTIAGEHIDRALFCSQHGELECAVKLLRNIATQTLLSPQNFAQSVHNTAAGLFSVIHKLHIDVAALAAGDDTFIMGMIEALTWLKLYPDKQILLVLFDEHIPMEYQQLQVKSNYEYALALLLGTGQTMTCNLTAGANCQRSQNLPLALEFLQWFVSPLSAELIQTGAQQTIQWHKG